MNLESGDKQVDSQASQKEITNWSANDNDRLWDYVNKFDGRVAGFSKDLGDFKGDVHKSIGELARAMEKGFGDMNTKFGDLKTEFARLETKIESVKSDFKLTKWQVHLIFAGTTTALVWLFKDYAESNFSLKKHQLQGVPLLERVVSQSPATQKPI